MFEINTLLDCRLLSIIIDYRLLSIFFCECIDWFPISISIDWLRLACLSISTICSTKSGILWIRVLESIYIGVKRLINFSYYCGHMQIFIMNGITGNPLTMTTSLHWSRVIFEPYLLYTYTRGCTWHLKSRTGSSIKAYKFFLAHRRNKKSYILSS